MINSRQTTPLLHYPLQTGGKPSKTLHDKEHKEQDTCMRRFEIGNFLNGPATLVKLPWVLVRRN